MLPVEVPLEDASGPSDEPLLLLALNGTTDARWEVMSSKVGRHLLHLISAFHISQRVGSGAQIGCVSRSSGEQVPRTDAAGVVDPWTRKWWRSKESDAEYGDFSGQGCTVRMSRELSRVIVLDTWSVRGKMCRVP